MDARRSRWIAFDAFFLHDGLGQDLRDRFGPAGVMLFLGFLCACKRNPIPGRITYANDTEALIVMGCQGLDLTNEHGDSYDLETFWTYLGQRKQTRRTRRGRLTNVESTKWGKWQKDLGRQQDAEKKATSRARKARDNAPTVPGQNPDDTPTIGGTDIDLDSDIDKDKTMAPAPLALNGGRRDVLWDAVVGVCGIKSDEITEHSRGGVGKAVAELRKVGATPDEVTHRAGVYRRTFPQAALTPTALAKHWAQCANLPRQVAVPKAAGALERALERGA